MAASAAAASRCPPSSPAVSIVTSGATTPSRISTAQTAPPVDASDASFCSTFSLPSALVRSERRSARAVCPAAMAHTVASMFRPAARPHAARSILQQLQVDWRMMLHMSPLGRRDKDRAAAVAG